jgi:hypothetical protein
MPQLYQILLLQRDERHMGRRASQLQWNVEKISF